MTGGAFGGIPGPADAAGWARKFQAVAMPALRGATVFEDEVSAEERAAFVEGFADDRGDRRRLDRYLLGHLLGVLQTRTDEGSRDVVLWSIVASEDGLGDADPCGLVEANGPMTAEDSAIGIEIWTETELACVHAFRSLIDRCGDAFREAARARLEDAVQWHTERLQPDNATNHPWAAHVFAEASLRGDTELAIEARMHADGLIHACLAGGGFTPGAPDRFSACVLLHAAAVLRSSLDS